MEKMSPSFTPIERPLGEAVIDCYVEAPIVFDDFFFNVPSLIMTPHIYPAFTKDAGH
jgi:phosphoglycerate dehydrogenase-like enzyme